MITGEQMLYVCSFLYIFSLLLQIVCIIIQKILEQILKVWYTKID